MRGKESEGELARAAGKAGIPIRYLKAGDRVRSGECAMEILWPEAGAEPAEGEENSASLVLKVRWKDFDALLTGDLEGEGEQELLGRLGPCEYLKVAHHGSGNSTGKEFLDAVRPEICVIFGAGTQRLRPSSPRSTGADPGSGRENFYHRETGSSAGYRGKRQDPGQGLPRGKAK